MIFGVYVDYRLPGESETDRELLLEPLNKKFRTKKLGECTGYDASCVKRNNELGTTLVIARGIR